MTAIGMTWLENGNRSADELYEMAEQHSLFVLIDACDSPEVPAMWQKCGSDRAVSLYSGVSELQFVMFAPYLFQVDVEILDWIRQVLWETPWGVFVFAPNQSLEEMRRHFRQFLLVQDPQGGEMHFRFYDPRVLANFLPTCNPMELKQYYGKVEAFLICSPDDPSQMQSFSRADHAKKVGVAMANSASQVQQPIPIRQAQMDVFFPQAEIAFESRLISHLHEHHEEAVEDLTDEMLLPMVRTGIARARRYGMTWESNLTAFVALMFEIAPNWDEHSFIQAVLNSRHIAPEDKMDVLVERTPEEVWEEAERRYDADAWFGFDEESN